MMCYMRKMGARFATAALMCAVAILAVLLLATSWWVVPAWADETSDGNLVDTQLLPDSSFIYDTLISDLEKADSYMDGQTVQVTGEAVGDCINDGINSGHCWIMLQAKDGSYAEITIYMTETFASMIDTYGAYGKKGTTLQVRGTFNLACDQHEGLSDLHADHVAIVENGSTTEDAFSASAFAPGLILGLIGLALFIVFNRMRESQR